MKNSIAELVREEIIDKKQYNIILLHGLFGSLSNWQSVIAEFGDNYKISMPHLPIYDFSLRNVQLDRLVKFLEDYIDQNALSRVILVGNSLGGHIALLYTIKHPDKVEKLVLTGSSGLYENSFGGSFPRIKDYTYISEKVSSTFYKKEVVTQDLIDEVYETAKSTSKVLSIISVARAAQKQNLANYLHQIKVPVLLVWGLQDEITPPIVANEFFNRLPNAKLRLINECGHVPMMEQPELFNQYLKEFLDE